MIIYKQFVKVVNTIVEEGVNGRRGRGKVRPQVEVFEEAMAFGRLWLGGRANVKHLTGT